MAWCTISLWGYFTYNFPHTFLIVCSCPEANITNIEYNCEDIWVMLLNVIKCHMSVNVIEEWIMTLSAVLTLNLWLFLYKLSVINFRVIPCCCPLSYIPRLMGPGPIQLLYKFKNIRVRARFMFFTFLYKNPTKSNYTKNKSGYKGFAK